MPAQPNSRSRSCATSEDKCADVRIDVMAVNSEWVRDLATTGQVLLLDFRPSSAFNQGHIQGALKVSIPKILLKRLQNGKVSSFKNLIQGDEAKEKFLRDFQSMPIVVYDEKSSVCQINSTNVDSAFVLLLNRMKENGLRVSFLEGGYEQFQLCHPELCTISETAMNQGNLLPDLGFDELHIEHSPEVKPETSADNFPVEILPFLFLGSKAESENFELLSRFGISYVLNVTPNIPNCFEKNGFKYMQIPIRDRWNQNLAMYFQDAIEFIDEARQANRGILVHCHGGVSRSVTVTVAYLMQKRGLSLNDAYDFVRHRKADISPSFNFLGQLQDFEVELHGCPCRYGKCTCITEGKRCLCPDPAYVSSASSSERTTPLSTNTSISSADSRREFEFLVEN